MKLYNSLSRGIEEFSPLREGSNKVGVYTCGPTVYFYPHVGNWRTFVLGDLMVRTLFFLGYEPHYLMNITDVGHLTGDNLGDSSAGDDRLEKAALKEGKTAWDVAEYYTKNFMEGYKKLNLTMPTGERFCKATDHILEQIEMIQKIEEKGFTYAISDGIYFDVGAYERAGHVYGLMSNIHKDNTKERIAENKEKRDVRDFALWKFSPEGEKRHMEWNSPWGVGFPGWHIECSAMSTKYLGDQFDVHIGGEDHKSTHHPNEIAQSEAATGKKPFVKYWLHGAFLQVDGGRMGKSLGNAYTLEDVEGKGFSAFDLRYFYMTGHYRKTLNFTWEGMSAAKKARERLGDMLGKLNADEKNEIILSSLAEDHIKKFRDSIEDDLNMPQALAELWEMMGDNQLSNEEKVDLASRFDEVLGLNLLQKLEEIIPDDILELVQNRDEFRKAGDWHKADDIRSELAVRGYEVRDTVEGGKARKIKA